jgi:hypothetical protein
MAELPHIPDSGIERFAMTPPYLRPAPWWNWLGLLALLTAVLWLLRGLGLLGFVPGIVFGVLFLAMGVLLLLGVWGVRSRRW